MSRLPSDAFLPSGGMFSNDQHAGFYRHSDVSPLSLPHSVQPPPRQYQFDNLASRISSDSNPHNPMNRSRSPRLTPPSSDLDKRTRSLSPAGRHTNAHAWIGSPSLSAVSSTSPDNNLDASALALQLRRVTLQNRRLLENWEAERTHLEANRARAEEVYREEREIMDEERDLWMQQKTSLELKIVELEQRAQQAENQRDTFARQLEFMSRQARVSSSKAQSPDSSSRKATSKSLIRSKSVSPPTSGGRSIRYLSPKDGISPLTGKPFAGTGMTMPESNPFVPLDQRMQGPSPGSTSPNECPAQIPSIDVSEVVPQLEGIRLKQPAIEKPTFAVVEPSATSSPSGAKAQSPSAASPAGSPNNKSRSSPVERAIQALQAPEHSRLTMHAGHTPNHSMSFSKLPTLMSTASGNTANTAGSSGAVTPNEPLEMGPINEHGSKIVAIAGTGIAHSGLEDGQAVSEDPHAIFEPSEGDRPLTGPTHLMNRPAVDEPFLALLSEKLQTTDPIPTVVRNALSEEAESVQQHEAPAAVPPISSNDRAVDTPGEPEKIEEDIPLKFKGGSNFGLPYGNLGSFGH